MDMTVALGEAAEDDIALLLRLLLLICHFLSAAKSGNLEVAG